MNAIGGYFELELNNFGEYHKDAISLNTARNALEYILIANKYKNIYIPYYTCEVILEPINKLNIEYEYYRIDKNFLPEIIANKANSALLYTNYFGICDRQVELAIEKFENVIVDNSQAFYSTRINSIDTFYSCRKFFGVPDGAYLYTNKNLKQNFHIDVSENRISHLIKRIEFGPEKGYHYFIQNDNNLSGQSINLMSNFTKALLNNIDYNKIKERRLENFYFLHNELNQFNELSIDFDSIICPMIYPFLKKRNKKVRNELIKNRIFVATYWPNVLQSLNEEFWEHYLTNNLIPLPIDQRYTTDDLRIILKLLKI